MFGREPPKSVMVSETRLLLPGIVLASRGNQEEIGHELSPPSERMLRNSVLKVIMVLELNGTNATIRDNLNHITITEQFMDQVTQVSHRIRRLPKQSKPYWIKAPTWRIRR